MFTLKKLNVVKVVNTESKRDELLSKGFTLVTDQKADLTSSSEKPLDKMTVDELKEYAAKKSIDISGAAKKDEILAKIKEAAQGTN
ncbi:MAG: hypothetical protein Q8920_04455 [Bacillota bacterium]|nr:hypothetical protein [Bacillota bacterium]